MNFSNAQKLATVLSEWARPALTDLATSRILDMPFLQSAQAMLINTGLVGRNYSLGNELKPFANNIVDSLLVPVLTEYLSKVPDGALPKMAHSVVNTAMQQPRFSVLDGLIEFAKEDMQELKELLDKNIPIEEEGESYELIK